MPIKDPIKAAEYKKKYYEMNIEKLSLFDKKKYERRKEYYKEKARIWASKNKSRVEGNSKRWRQENSEYLKMFKKKYRHENIEIVRQKEKMKYWGSRGLDAVLKRNFGITLEQFKSMNASQGGLCAICRKPPQMSRLSVDHCHKTGKIRGLLCGRCNTGIGMLDDSIELTKSALLYLEKYKNV